jgi:hypothetical protein
VARGWESKSVESQMEEAAERKRASTAQEIPVREQELLRELRVLQLSRTRVIHQIEEATHAGYREIMSRALADLDQRLAQLEKRLTLPPD